MTEKNKSLLIILDKNLEIYEIEENLNCNFIYMLNREVSPDNSHKLLPLNLSDSFEAIWEEIVDKVQFNNIIYVIGGKCSFTDSRVVWIWLKTWQMTNNLLLNKKAENLPNIYLYSSDLIKVELSTINAGEAISEQIFIDQLNAEALQKKALLNPASLPYVHEPNIGI